MHKDGFSVTLKVDLDNGFIIGGNGKNCLTWMDKMGSSAKAGNKGFPATSRNGAPVELVGLLKCALEFVHRAYKEHGYPYNGV